MTSAKQTIETTPVWPDPAPAASKPLKCVWSGFPGDERSCRSRIPTSVVVRAWHRQMQLGGPQEGFFHFSWRSGVWLGYGLRDGGVRGVYCPTHCSERESRGGREPELQVVRGTGEPEPHVVRGPREAAPTAGRATGTAL